MRNELVIKLKTEIAQAIENDLEHYEDLLHKRCVMEIGESGNPISFGTLISHGLDTAKFENYWIAHDEEDLRSLSRAIMGDGSQKIEMRESYPSIVIKKSEIATIQSLQTLINSYGDEAHKIEFVRTY